MGAALSSAERDLLADAPLDVVERLQFQDFPDLFLVVVRLQLAGGVDLTRLLLRSERGVGEQVLRAPFQERRVAATADLFESDEYGPSADERRYWCSDGSVLLRRDEDLGAQFVTAARLDPVLQVDAGGAFPLRPVRAVPDWADVLDAARAPPLEGAAADRARARPHTQEWPPETDPEAQRLTSEGMDLVAAVLIERRRHRARIERAMADEWHRRSAVDDDANRHMVAGSRPTMSDDSEAEEAVLEAVATR